MILYLYTFYEVAGEYLEDFISPSSVVQVGRTESMNVGYITVGFIAVT